MYVTKLEVANVRGFLNRSHRTELDLGGRPGWYVLAGRNGSGKSTLLRALALVLAGPEHAPVLLRSSAGWIRNGEDSAVVKVELVPSEEDSLEEGAPERPSPLRGGLGWHATAGGRAELRPTPATKSKNPLWKGPWSNKARGWLATGYGPFRRPNLHTSDAHGLMVGSAAQRRLVTLFREDASLCEAVKWVQTVQYQKLEEQRGAKERLDHVIALLNDGLLPDDGKIARIGSDGVWVTHKGSVEEVPLEHLSDGYRVVLTLALDLLRHIQDAYGDKTKIERNGTTVRILSPAVVLIDEVDAHLHVSWQQRLGFWLTERFPGVQFLVTTHSPFVCQAATPGGLFRMPEPGEKRAASPVDEKTYHRIVNGTVNDAVLSSLFGMDTIHSKQAMKLLKEWSGLRAHQNSRPLTSDERERFIKLTNQLPALEILRSGR